MDPFLFYFSESKIRSRDYLFALLVAAVGDRPLGSRRVYDLGTNYYLTKPGKFEDWSR
jgi:hypothetical protein